MLSAGFKLIDLSSSEWVILSVYLLAVFLCVAVAYKMYSILGMKFGIGDYTGDLNSFCCWFSPNSSCLASFEAHM